MLVIFYPGDFGPSWPEVMGGPRCRSPSIPSGFTQPLVAIPNKIEWRKNNDNDQFEKLLSVVHTG